MESERIFLDTSGWIALLKVGDDDHVVAVRLWRDLVRRGAVATLTDWIIAETGNGLARTRARVPFARAVPLLAKSPEFRVMHVDDGLRGRAIDVYESRIDKSWGLVDCVSFLVMEDLGIRDAFTSDHHYEQAGFRRLITGPPPNGRSR